MSQALYRKYRSQSFEELVGQSAVTRMLRNGIVRGRVSHAYLFCGPRGTGKTSVARIFSKAINCLDQKDGDCCTKCEVCRSVANGNAPDVVELDAASHRKVEEITKILIERVGYAPLSFKRKIYIIDEVHMLSPTSFNALLKTLEEPPEHVVFCLCTTEPHKLPVTILSRCIRFDFQRLPLAELAAHLKWIASEEDFELEQDAADKLTELAEGSARDAISLLDQLLVYCSGKITSGDVSTLFQLGDSELAVQVAQQLEGSDPAPLLNSWEELVNQGADAGQFLLRVGGELKQRYLDTQDHRWKRALEKIWQALNLLRYESFPGLLVELALISAWQEFHASQPQAPQPAVPAQSQPQPQTQAAKRPAPAQPQQQPRPQAPQPASQASARPQPGTQESSKQDTPARRQPQIASSADSKADNTDPWQMFLRYLKGNYFTTYALLTMDVTGDKEDGLLVIEFAPVARQAFRFIQDRKHHDALVKAAAKAYGKPLQVAVELDGDKASRLLVGDAAAQQQAPQSTQEPRPRPGDNPPGPTVVDDEMPEPADYDDEGVPPSAEELAGAVGKPDKPEKMERSLNDMGSQLAKADTSEKVNSRTADRPATKRDVMELFDAKELGEHENED